MVPSDSDVSRLLAGETPVDDPGLNEVATFLSDLRSTYPPAPVDAVRESHLVAVAEQARRQAEVPSPRRRRVARRTVAVVSVAALSVLTAGVGVAAAMGGNPLTLLPGLRLGPPEAPRSASPDPVASEREPQSEPAAGASTPAPSDTRSPQPTNAGVSSAKSSPTPSDTGGTTDDEIKSNNGKSDQAKAEHKPTAKPTQAKNEHKPTPKPTQAKNNKADPPVKARPEEKPPPPAKGGKAAG